MQSCSQTLVTTGGTGETIQAALHVSLVEARFERVAGDGDVWSRCGTAVGFAFGSGDQWGVEWWPKAHINETDAAARTDCERALVTP